LFSELGDDVAMAIGPSHKLRWQDGKIREGRGRQEP